MVLNLLKLARAPLHIYWFDKDNAFSKGLAYATPHPYHLLNVRAANMSLYQDDAGHFADWLSRHHPQYTANDFVPRRLYAAYAADELQMLRARHPLVTIDILAQEVADLQHMGSQYEVTADRVYSAEQVILALGNFSPAHPRSSNFAYTRSGRYFQDPFHEACLPAALQAPSVLIIGSGLTMIDMVLSLYNHAYKSPVSVISTHGYLPQSHGPGTSPSLPAYLDPHQHYTLAGLVSLVNRALKTAKTKGYDVQSVVDQLRPGIQGRWLKLSAAEKKQFLRHLRHKWGVARHRAPGESEAVLRHMAANGQLSVIKGRISDIDYHNQLFTVHYTDGQGRPATTRAGCIINCTGPESDYHQVNSQLVKKLLAAGTIAADEIRYGIQASADGTISRGLYTLGPPLKGILWESTAIPEIRAQAHALALKIIQD